MTFRGAACSVFAIVATIAFASVAHGAGGMQYLAFSLALLVASAVTVHLPGLGPQVLARAVWWGNLVLGVVVACTGGSSAAGAFTIISVACGGALLVAERERLASATEAAGFGSVTLRHTLLLLIVLALADAQTFLLFAILSLDESGPEARQLTIPLFLFGIAFVVGFLGLYRLRLWGAVLNAVTSGLAVVTLFALLARHDTLTRFLGGLAVAHFVVVTPIVILTLRGKSLPLPPARLRTVGGRVVIAGMMALALMAAGVRVP